MGMDIHFNTLVNMKTYMDLGMNCNYDFICADPVVINPFTTAPWMKDEDKDVISKNKKILVTEPNSFRYTNYFNKLKNIEVSDSKLETVFLTYREQYKNIMTESQKSFDNIFDNWAIVDWLDKNGIKSVSADTTERMQWFFDDGSLCTFSPRVFTLKDLIDFKRKLEDQVRKDTEKNNKLALNIVTDNDQITFDYREKGIEETKDMVSVTKKLIEYFKMVKNVANHLISENGLYDNFNDFKFKNKDIVILMTFDR